MNVGDSCSSCGTLLPSLTREPCPNCGETRRNLEAKTILAISSDFNEGALKAYLDNNVVSAIAKDDTPQWKTLRSTNVIERLHEEFRRRVKTQGSLPSEDAALVLLFSLVASGQIKLRKRLAEDRCGAQRTHDGGRLMITRGALTAALALSLLVATLATEAQSVGGKVPRIGFLQRARNENVDVFIRRGRPARRTHARCAAPGRRSSLAPGGRGSSSALPGPRASPRPPW